MKHMVYDGKRWVFRVTRLGSNPCGYIWLLHLVYHEPTKCEWYNQIFNRIDTNTSVLRYTWNSSNRRWWYETQLPSLRHGASLPSPPLICNSESHLVCITCYIRTHPPKNEWSRTKGYLFWYEIPPLFQHNCLALPLLFDSLSTYISLFLMFRF